MHGRVRVEVLTDRPEDRFAVGSVLVPEGSGRSLTVASAAPVADGPGWWLTFREVRSRTAAEVLRDVYLEVAVDRGSDLPTGQAYWHEVVGAVIRTADGRTLGRVTDVYRAGEAEVYVISRDGGGEFDLPAVRGIVTEFAPERGEIVVDEAALDLGGAPVDATPRRPHRVHRWSRHGKGATATGSAGPPEPGEGETPA